MKRLMTMAMVAAMAGTVVAAEPEKKNAANPTDAQASEAARIAEKKAAQREKFLSSTGGMVPNKKNAKGSIAFIDAQKLVSGEFVQKRMHRLQDQVWFHTNYVPYDEPVTLDSVAEATKTGKGTVSVVLAEAGTLPAIVHLPEMRTVIVNVNALNKDAPDKAKLESRVAKEISRAFAFVIGIGYSQTPGGLMSPYTSLAELDDIFVDMLPADLALNSDYQAGVFGITRFSRATYKKACQEGWAEPPKNDYQKAIWEKVRSEKERGPTNAIKILPPNKQPQAK